MNTLVTLGQAAHCINLSRALIGTRVAAASVTGSDREMIFTVTHSCSEALRDTAIGIGELPLKIIQAKSDGPGVRGCG